MPDGTVHSTSRVRRHSMKNVKKSWKSIDCDDEEEIFNEDVMVPGSSKEEVIETFNEPARRLSQMEDIEKFLPDGTKVKQQIVMNRMVHKVKTRQKSIDESGNECIEEFEVDETIPGTESCFLQDSDSSSSTFSDVEEEDEDFEDEEEVEAELGEIEETLEDGTVVTHRLLETKETVRVTQRSGSVEEEETTKTITEERICPSPRPQSPADNQMEEVAKEVVQRTIRSAHFEASHKGEVVETSFDVTEDKVVPPHDHPLHSAMKSGNLAVLTMFSSQQFYNNVFFTFSPTYPCFVFVSRYVLLGKPPLFNIGR